MHKGADVGSQAERYIVRPMAESDLEVIVPWFDEFDAFSKFDRAATVPVSADAMRRVWLDDLKATTVPPRARWFIVWTQAGEPVALGGLQSIDHIQGDSVLPIFVAREMRNRGIGIRLLALLLDVAFRRLRLERITTYFRSDNLASAHMLEKTGFTSEGRLRKAWLADGKRLDMLVVGMLATEWETRRGGLRQQLDEGTIVAFAHQEALS